MSSKVLHTVFLALLTVIFISADKGLIEIVNSGSTNTPGYTIIIEPCGQAQYYIQPRRFQIISLNSTDQRPSDTSGTNGTAKLSRTSTKDLYYQVEQSQPFSALPVRPCGKSVSFGFTLKLTYRGQTTPDLTCPTNNPQLANLTKAVRSVIAELKI